MTAAARLAAVARLAATIDRLNAAIGRIVMWLVVALVLAQFSVVILRYVFAVGSVALQESIWYMHATLFLAGAGYALREDAHVRVDLFYRDMSPRKKALVDLLGTLFLLLPLAVAIVWLSWGYVLAAWRVREGSTEVSGLPFLFLLKSMIWVFAVLVGLQGLALAMRAALFLAGAAPGYRAAGAPSGRASEPIG